MPGRFVLETVGEEAALALLRRGDDDWIPKENMLILDIDEDFFGCEAAQTRFKEVRDIDLLFLGIQSLPNWIFGCLFGKARGSS